MRKKRIYMDYASLTPIDPRVVAAMEKYSSADFANPSSWYREGVEARKVMDESQKTVAGFLNAHPDEIIFTSGGTESNNLAILGTVEELHKRGLDYREMHVMASAIEHSSVLMCLSHLQDLGVKTDLVSVDKTGLIDVADLKRKLKPNTVLVSVMMVNNEIGTVEPIRDIAKILRHHRKAHGSPHIPLLHTDASQAALYIKIDVERLGADLVTLDGSKVYGPRGMGCLYKKRAVSLQPVLFGGGQQGGLRSGTENLPAIAGFAKALEIASADRERELERVLTLRKQFVDGLSKIRPDATINGVLDIGLGEDIPASPHILNVSIPGIDNEFFLFRLDANGIACSTRSSCLRDEDESYVLQAIGADNSSSIRFSFGRWTKKSDISACLAFFMTFC